MPCSSMIVRTTPSVQILAELSLIHHRTLNVNSDFSQQNRHTNAMRYKNMAYNRRAKHDYELLETMEAGISLLGTEVKSVKAGHMSLRSAFVTIHDEQAFLTNATIPPWQPKNTPDSYDPTRSRQLLLKKSELKQLIGSRKSKGLTIVPIRVYNKGGRVKIEIALARGKKQYEKKQQKKEADIKRDTEKMLSDKND